MTTLYLYLGVFSQKWYITYKLFGKGMPKQHPIQVPQWYADAIKNEMGGSVGIKANSISFPFEKDAPDIDAFITAIELLK